MTFLLESARTSFELLLSIGAGSGLLYLLRWYWWRINAWSEIAAMAVSFVVSIGFFVAGKTGLRRRSKCRLAHHRLRDDVRVDRRDAGDATGERRDAGPLLHAGPPGRIAVGADSRKSRRRRIARQYSPAATRLGPRLYLCVFDALRRRQRSVRTHGASHRVRRGLADQRQLV